MKQRALSENRERVDDSKLAFKILLRNFDKFDPDKRNGNELFVFSKYGSQRPLLATAVLKLYYKSIFARSRTAKHARVTK